MSTYSVLPVTEPDLPAMGQAIYTSKLTLTINRLLFYDWPNEPAQMALYSSAPISSFKDPNAQMWKVVDHGSGETVGHCVLTRKVPTKEEGEKGPEEKEKAGKKVGEETVPYGVNAEVLDTVSKACMELNKEMKGIEHFGLTHIYVKLSHRRRGIGSQLIQMCIDEAKKASLPLFILSEPAAHDLFLGKGFKDTKHVDIDLSRLGPKYCGFGIFRLAGMVLGGSKSKE